MTALCVVLPSGRRAEVPIETLAPILAVAPRPVRGRSGRVSVRLEPSDLSEAVPLAVAALMLGVSRQRVHQLCNKGSLVRSDRGVEIGSVLGRLVVRS